ncbi:UDP-N-acetylglucosamine 1-carboxyvinyltransferase [Celeribacter sp.]|uniref:UDP-N-acetylglucosamine 1-carboxyvinyltransferase n=1 Tax=Celeribacter sp. TaxID=1890673 RepID=UPI003A95C4FF
MYAVIDGGVVPRGKVRVSGAKNSATRLLAASLLSDEAVVLRNFPTRLVDVGHKIGFCEKLGAQISINHATETAQIDATSLKTRLLTRDDYDVPIRTTYLLTAAQILRSGMARIPYPGGCPIGGGSGGGRGYDQHILVWEALGATVVEKDDHIEISAQQGFVGGDVHFTKSTVGGTENALMSAAIAKGQTRIYNAYITPEIEDLIKFLRRMGAEIEVSGASHIVVDGRGGALGGTHMSVMSDRIEALTWLVYAAISGGELTIENVPFSSMEVPLLHMRHAGIDFFQNQNSIHVTPDCLTSGSVQPFELACGAHPGVISDMQSFFVMLALKAEGTSRIFDYRYPDRIAFVHELAKLVSGDHLDAETGKIVVRGPAQFKPGVADSTDLRGSMAAVMAALCADGRSVIENVHMALRGYNGLADKLASIGGRIEIHEGRKAAQ